MAAPPAGPAWHQELRCDGEGFHAAVCDTLRFFLDDADAFELDVQSLGIRVLPPSYFALAAVRGRLTRFDCSNNRLASLPSELGRCGELEYLATDVNYLESYWAELTANRRRSLATMDEHSLAVAWTMYWAAIVTRRVKPARA